MNSTVDSMYMYYQGIGMITKAEDGNKLCLIGKEMVEDAKKKGKTECDNLGKEIKKEMDTYAKILKEMSPNTHPTLPQFQEMINKFPHIKNKGMKYFLGLWFSNVTVLMELGMIQNDENNGPLSFKEYKV